MRGASVADEAGEQRGSEPSAGRLLVVMGLAVLVGGACLALIWSTLNAFGSEAVGSERLVLAGLAVGVLIALVAWCYRALSALASGGRRGQPAPEAGPDGSAVSDRIDEGEAH
jgi:hypothetical protein